MLSGEKVLLRAMTRDDLKRRWEFSSDPAFALLVNEEPWEPQSLERFEAHFSQDLHRSLTDSPFFAIEADGCYIGHCLLYRFDLTAQTCMLGIGIGDPAYQNRGYGRDALGVLLRYAFRLRNMHKVWLSVSSTNERAIRAYRACGFVEEGRMRQQIWLDGGYADLVYMGLLREDWKSLQEGRNGDSV